MTLKGKLAHVEVSDVGKVRDHNEDTIGAQPEIGLWVLADGMGGYNAGEVASGIAVKTILNLVAKPGSARTSATSTPRTGYTRAAIVLRDAIQRANKIIYQTAQIAAAVRGHGHDGGREPVLRQPRLHRPRRRLAPVPLARQTASSRSRMDHSLLQELVDRGFYSPEEAQRATNRTT